MKNEALPIVEISMLSKAIRNNNRFCDELVLIELGKDTAIPNQKDEDPLPMRLNGFTVILIRQGVVTISIDYIKYKIKANTLLTITPDHIVCFHGRTSNTQGEMLVIGKSFIELINMGKTPPSMQQYMYLRKNPSTLLTEIETRALEVSYNVLSEKLELTSHHFYREVVQNALLGVLLEMANVFQSKQDEVITPSLSRKEELMEQFLRLLYESVKKEHRVTFYAEKLFITPQYLSAILKDLSGKPANKWIDDALILEAKLLLKTPQATVQEVADTLSFSDQSTFGKFFKKQVGLSPMEYRKS